MTIQLIYHTNGRQKSSPFDKAICELVTKKDIAIACPYLGISYLQKILSLCNTWRLLTDVSAWLDSYIRNPEQLFLIQEFIEKNTDHIHHYHNIHAKVIIAQDGALIGSANLTNQGIRYRQEMSVLIKSSIQVEELFTWFNRLWEDTDCLDKREKENIDSYVKTHLQLKRERPPIDDALDLRLPKTASELPKDIKREQVGDLQLFTIKHITSLIADEEETIQWDSIRRWIYYMINHGKIRAYRFNRIQFVDEEGVKELWQFRSQINEGGRNKSIRKPKNIIKIPKGQLLTLQDIAKRTGKSCGKIRELMRNNRIQCKFHERSFIFDPGVIDQIKSLAEERTGHKRLDIVDIKIKRLTPLTRAESFVLEVREREDPPFSWQKITDMAREENITKAKTRSWSQGIYRKAYQKRKMLKQTATKINDRREIDEHRKRNN